MTLTTDQSPDRLQPFGNVNNSPLPPPLPSNTPPFYVVSMKKFWLLCMFTFTLYVVYWSYKQWQNWKIATGEKVMPIARAIFWVFMVWGLIRRIFDRAKLVDTSLNFRTLEKSAGVAMIGGFASRLLDRLTRNQDITFTYVGLTILFFVMVAGGIAKIQQYANIACHDPQGTQNNKLTWANYIWLVIGGLLWLCVIFGAVAPFLGINLDQ